MRRQPTSANRTDTLLPYPTLCRAVDAAEHVLHLEAGAGQVGNLVQRLLQALGLLQRFDAGLGLGGGERGADGAARELQPRSEEHTSELQSLMRISSAVFCLKNKTTIPKPRTDALF